MTRRPRLHVLTLLLHAPHISVRLPLECECKEYRLAICLERQINLTDHLRRVLYILSVYKFRLRKRFGL